MRIIGRRYNRKTNKLEDVRVNVASAVEQSLIGIDSDQLSEMRGNTINLQRAFGQLIQQLHENCHLTDVQVAEYISHPLRVED